MNTILTILFFAIIAIIISFTTNIVWGHITGRKLLGINNELWFDIGKYAFYLFLIMVVIFLAFF